MKLILQVGSESWTGWRHVADVDLGGDFKGSIKAMRILTLNSLLA